MKGEVEDPSQSKYQTVIERGDFEFIEQDDLPKVDDKILRDTSIKS